MQRCATPAAAAVLLGVVLTAAPAAADIGAELRATGLAETIYVAQPVGEGRLFVVERAGRIRIIDEDGLQAAPYFDISSGISTAGEGGLLGIAFAPDFVTSGVLYTYSTPLRGTSAMDSHIERITVSTPGAETAGTLTRETVLRFAQPHNNHNAGWIGFAPSDTAGQYLYIPLGDGGSLNDPDNLAQPLDNVFGKVLRLDVSGGDDFPADANRNYVVPADNFFAADGDATTLGEIVARGLRNPFRNSFDRATGDLYLGDVGQDNREEVSVLAANVQGQNFGWRIREGDIDNPSVGGTLLASERVDPLFDYAHFDDGSGTPLLGGTITGGYVYRGSRLGAGYQGLYFFGDFISGRFFTIDPAAADVDASLTEITAELFPGGFGTFDFVSWGEDAAGELYVIDRDGQVYAIVPDPGAAVLAPLAAIILLRRRRKAAGAA